MLISLPQSNSTSKRWLFRLFAVLLGFLPLVLLEIGLTVAGVGLRDRQSDPFVEFSTTHPLFVVDEEEQQVVIAPNRLAFFAPDKFPLEKSPGTYRIFCLGGSTVQGRPYSVETSFTSWLQLGLNVADSNRKWEVVNCGGVSYASYRLLPILQECLDHRPDLIILCTGHNEFLEDRTYAKIKQSPLWVRRSVNQASQLRTVAVVSSLFERENEKSVLAADADAILDYKNGLAAYHRDEEWHRSIAHHFDSNIRRMIRICRTADVPLLLMLPPSNLSGAAPFKSVPKQLIPSEELSIQTMKEEARSLYQTDLGRAVTLWQKVCQIDDFSADNHYELGKCLEHSNRYDAARKAFLMARDLDVCPLRMTSSLEQVLIHAASDTQTPIIDLHRMLQEKTSNGIVGDRWLVDHVHPNFEGHQQVAFTIGRWLDEVRVVNLEENWETESQPVFNEHFKALSRTYFHKGQRALHGLELWTQGNADGPPVEDRFPHLLREQ